MPEIVQRSFTSGELAPSLRARVDVNKYQTGLALCQDFIIRAQGGVYSRPGTRYVGEVGDSTRQARLIPFSFNTEQTYILVFEHLTMRVIKDGGYILDGGSPYELVTTYTEAQLSRLAFAQSNDVLTIVHPDHDPANLSRVTETNWTLTDIDYSSSVTAPTWITLFNLAISNITQADPAVVTVPTTAALTTGDIAGISGVGGMGAINGQSSRITVIDGTTFSLDNIDSSGYGAYVSGGNATFSDIATTGSDGAGTYKQSYNYVVTAVDADGIESLASDSKSLTTESLTTIAGIGLKWNSVAGADHYRIYKDPSDSTGFFGWIGDSNTETFIDFNFAPITSDSPPVDRQPFSGADDKPKAVTYYQQRQVFANTDNEPQALYTTQTSNYSSLRISNPARDDDAVTFTIAANQVNEIRHLLSLDSLILLTSSAEWKVTEGQDQVLTPYTIGIKTQSFNGASWVPPVIINNTAIYVQEKGGRIRDLGYQFSADKFEGNDLSLMSEHLFEGYQITEMAFSAEPYGILWCVRDDGVLLGLTYQREHQVWGWHQHALGGNVESVAVIGEDNRDALYMVVNRTIDGSTVRYIERMEIRDVSSATNAFCVDSGLTYDGAPATVISGLDHLEGEDVAVLADGNEVTGLIVTSGSITLPTAASVVHVGLLYTPAIELLDIDSPEQTTIKSKTVSVSQVTIEVESSRGGFVGPKLDDGSTGQMLEIKPRFESDSYDAIDLRTHKEVINIDPQWVRGGGIRIEQRSPLPLAILSVIPRVDIGG
jgi:hypothetical protein